MAAPQTDPSAAIAVLQTEVGNIKSIVSRVETKLDRQDNLLVTRAEFNEFKQRWFLSHTLAALAGAVVTGVLVYIITGGR